MKKTVSLILILAMITALFAGCHTNAAPETDPSADHHDSTEAVGSETEVPAADDSTAPSGGESNSDAQEPSPSAPAENEGDNIPDELHTHSYTEKVVAPTCTEDGYTVYTCQCGDSYRDQIVPATGHSFGQWEVVKKPTTEAEGQRQRKCSVCGNTETQSIPKEIPNHTHKYTESITKQPTCTQEGVKTYKCSCGAYYTESLPKTPHSYTSKVVAPTCSSQGYTVHTCKCGASYKDSYVSAKAHEYVDEVVAPTCEKGGYTVHRCKNCGASYKNNVTSAIGHNYEQVANTATCESSGVITEKCTKCGNTKTYSSDALGHKLKKETKKATCSEDGYEREVCTVCGKVVSEHILSANGHHKWERRNVAQFAHEMVDAGQSYSYWYPYFDKTAFTIEACPLCGEINPETVKCDCEGSVMAQQVLDIINDYRAQHFGTHDYDLVLSSKLNEVAYNSAKTHSNPSGRYCWSGGKKGNPYAYSAQEIASALIDASFTGYLLEKNLKYYGLGISFSGDLDYSECYVYQVAIW